jgi:hypothetical protein
MLLATAIVFPTPLTPIQALTEEHNYQENHIHKLKPELDLVQESSQHTLDITSVVGTT